MPAMWACSAVAAAPFMQPNEVSLSSLLLATGDPGRDSHGYRHRQVSQFSVIIDSLIYKTYIGLDFHDMITFWALAQGRSRADLD